MVSRQPQVASSIAAVAGMLAMPFARRGGPVRRVIAHVVVTAMCAATASASVRRWGAVRGLAAAASTISLTTVIEHVGVTTARPFGRYRYTAALQPQVAGVPVIVPLAWFAMAVPARETAHAALGARSTPVTRILAGAATMTAWDLFLDPQMVGEGYWRWMGRGAYRGIPLSNYLGWFVTSLAVMAALELALPPGEPAGDLIAEYAVMGAMEAAGFATFFADRVVAVAGGVGMLPVSVLAVARLVGQRP